MFIRKRINEKWKKDMRNIQTGKTEKIKERKLRIKMKVNKKKEDVNETKSGEGVQNDVLLKTKTI